MNKPFYIITAFGEVECLTNCDIDTYRALKKVGNIFSSEAKAHIMLGKIKALASESKA